MPCRDSTRRRPTQARTTIAAALPSPITSRPLCHRSMPPLPAWLPFGVVQSDTDTFIDSFIYVKPALCSHPPAQASCGDDADLLQHAEAAAGAGSGHLLPHGAVPAPDQGLVLAAAAEAAHRPRIARRQDGHAGQRRV